MSFLELKTHGKIGFLSNVNPLLICIQFCCLFHLLKSWLRMIGVNKFVLYFVLSRGLIGMFWTLITTVSSVSISQVEMKPLWASHGRSRRRAGEVVFPQRVQLAWRTRFQWSVGYRGATNTWPLKPYISNNLCLPTSFFTFLISF